MTVWASGNMVIIFLAGLQSVPAQLYEAAELDGARFFRRLFHITIPMCSPILFYNIVICVINSLQSFTQAYIMTKGGPNNASLFYVLLLYRAAFTNQAMGYSSAMSWVFFIAIAVLSLISFKVSNLWVFYENDGA
jgi:multiple sugar transport system permease protein